MISLSHPGAHAALRGLDRRDPPRAAYSTGLTEWREAALTLSDDDLAQCRRVVAHECSRAPPRMSPQRERGIIACIVAAALVISGAVVAARTAKPAAIVATRDLGEFARDGFPIELAPPTFAPRAIDAELQFCAAGSCVRVGYVFRDGTITRDL